MRTARLLQVSLAVQVIAGAALAAWLLPAGGWRWLALPIGLAAPGVTTVTSLALQLIIDACIDPRLPRGGWRNALRVWAIESKTSLAAFCWGQPFGDRFPDPPLVRDPARPAVLLVHGYVCNRAIWRPLLESGCLARCNVATVNLEPAFAGIDDYAAPLGAAVDALQRASGAARVTLVCHSMGGLAARAYLRAHPDAPVDRLITIATPHCGTLFAHFGSGRNSRQMRCGSTWLAELAAATTPEQFARQVHIASRDDNLINPRAGLVVDGATSYWLEGVGHLAMVCDPRVWKVLAAELGCAGS